jgi:FtsH-binding integral membrane protein
MSHANVRDRIMAAADAPARERADFIARTYTHLGWAVLAFAGLSAILVKTVGPQLTALMASTPMSWLLVLGLFMVAGWVAQKWAANATSIPMQYAGLALYVVAEAVIFVPILYIAANFAGPDVIPTAGIITLAIFGGLTAVVMVSKKDFSFMGRFLQLATFAALGLIVVSLLFGFSLGLLFTSVMILLMSGWILYQTSNILHHYPIGSHVAASLALFAAVATLFWYVLRFVMAFASDD